MINHKQLSEETLDIIAPNRKKEPALGIRDFFPNAVKMEDFDKGKPYNKAMDELSRRIRRLESFNSGLAQENHELKKRLKVSIQCCGGDVIPCTEVQEDHGGFVYVRTERGLLHTMKSDLIFG